MKSLIRRVLLEETKERDYNKMLKLATNYIKNVGLNGLCNVKLVKSDVDIIGVIFTQGHIGDTKLHNLEGILKKIFHISFILVEYWKSSCSEFDVLQLDEGRIVGKILKEEIMESVRDRLVLKWLNKEFGDLTEVVRDDRTFYVDKDRKPLFFYYQDLKNGYVYVNNKRIWVFFKDIFGLKKLQTKEILKVWLDQTYNLRGLTPYIDRSPFPLNWNRPII
jgi:hypothetical protein